MANPLGNVFDLLSRSGTGSTAGLGYAQLEQRNRQQTLDRQLREQELNNLQRERDRNFDLNKQRFDNTAALGKNTIANSALLRAQNQFENQKNVDAAYNANRKKQQYTALQNAINFADNNGLITKEELVNPSLLSRKLTMLSEQNPAFGEFLTAQIRESDERGADWLGKYRKVGQQPIETDSDTGLSIFKTRNADNTKDVPVTSEGGIRPDETVPRVSSDFITSKFETLLTRMFADQGKLTNLQARSLAEQADNTAMSLNFKGINLREGLPGVTVTEPRPFPSDDEERLLSLELDNEDFNPDEDLIAPKRPSIDAVNGEKTAREENPGDDISALTPIPYRNVRAGDKRVNKAYYDAEAEYLKLKVTEKSGYIEGTNAVKVGTRQFKKKFKEMTPIERAKAISKTQTEPSTIKKVKQSDSTEEIQTNINNGINAITKNLQTGAGENATIQPDDGVGKQALIKVGEAIIEGLNIPKNNLNPADVAIWATLIQPYSAYDVGTGEFIKSATGKIPNSMFANWMANENAAGTLSRQVANSTNTLTSVLDSLYKGEYTVEKAKIDAQAKVDAADAKGTTTSTNKLFTNLNNVKSTVRTVTDGLALETNESNRLIANFQTAYVATLPWIKELEKKIAEGGEISQGELADPLVEASFLAYSQFTPHTSETGQMNLATSFIHLSNAVKDYNDSWWGVFTSDVQTPQTLFPAMAMTISGYGKSETGTEAYLDRVILPLMKANGNKMDDDVARALFVGAVQAKQNRNRGLQDTDRYLGTIQELAQGFLENKRNRQ